MTAAVMATAAAAHARVEVREQSQVGSARRLASALAARAGLPETDAARAALAATELATNLVKHAGGGHLLLRALDGEDGGAGVEMLALDTGRGMANVAAALRDGYSTAGSNGTGLGAIARTSDEFDVWSRPEAGSVIAARVLAKNTMPHRPAVLGAVCVPHPAEQVSGDAWTSVVEPGQRSVLVVDGLGHGAAAAAAAAAGVGIFRQARSMDAVDVVQRLHAGLRPTRGAALAAAVVDEARGVVRYAGIGNISSTILANGTTRSLVSHHGTAGHDARRIQEFTYEFPRGAVLVMHSDGLTARWSVERYPGLLERHPVVIAALLYRDFGRGRDDATVVVLKGVA